MQIFADSSDIAQIRGLNDMGLVDGVTTNPTILLKNKSSVQEVVKELSAFIDGSIHIQLMENDADKLVKEGEKIAKLSEKVVVKISLTKDGLIACRKLEDSGIKVNMTLCFSSLQALVAAKAGASYVSLFIGRLDDVGIDSLDVVSECCEIWQNYPDITSQLIVASLRNAFQVSALACMGVDIVTVSPAIIWKMVEHNLTDIGLKKFQKDFAALD